MGKPASEYWVSVPAGDGEAAWTGRIALGDEPRAPWTFDLLRQEEWSKATYVDPFETKPSVVALLDYQKNGTLIRARTNVFSPGSRGVDYPVRRRRLEGTFSHLLDGLAVEDAAEPIFAGIAFESEALRLWHSPTFGPEVDRGHSGSLIDTSAESVEAFDVPGLGNFKLRCWIAHIDQRQLQTIQPRVTLNLTLDRPRSLLETVDIAWALEALFGFLIGYRLRPPRFRLWQTKTYTLSSGSFPYHGDLVLGGARWMTERTPDSFGIQHSRSQADGQTASVISALFRGRESVMKNIFVTERARFFTNLVDQSFISVMPTLEAYLRERYPDRDVHAYAAKKDEFFAYVNAAPDKDLIEFCKKHLKETGPKPPSLQQLLERAISDMGDSAFVFPADLAKRIAARRHESAHLARSHFEADEVQALSTETRGAILLLMLMTYRDLGIPVAELSGERMRFAWFHEFLRPSKRDGRGHSKPPEPSS